MQTFEKEANESRKGAKVAEMDGPGIGKEIVDAVIAVPRELGSGLLETVHEVVLLDELRKRGLHAERQVPMAILMNERPVVIDQDGQVHRWADAWQPPPGGPGLGKPP